VLILLAVLILPLVGIFAWSFYQPVLLGRQGQGVSFGRTTNDLRRHATSSRPGFISNVQANFGWWAVKLPGGRKSGWYGVVWVRN
jgi:hypothetical protein